jgi:hypothetical protein
MKSIEDESKYATKRLTEVACSRDFNNGGAYESSCFQCILLVVTLLHNWAKLLIC